MQFLMSNFKTTPSWVPFSPQDMVNYPMDELMKVYAKAKLAAENNVNSNNYNKFESEAKNFESKLEQYYDKREDLKYEELLNEIRSLRADNKELERKFEEERERNKISELERTKQELARAESELNRTRAEAESLKEINSKHDQERLVSDIVKKNESIMNNISLAAQRLDFDEAYNQLSDIQKHYFNVLKDYALMQPKARVKASRFYITIGVGNAYYVKLAIKRGNVVACFKNDDEDLRSIDKHDASIKIRETEIKIVDKNSVEAAKHMIDLKVYDIVSGHY